MKKSNTIFLSVLILAPFKSVQSFRAPDPGGRFQKVVEQISSLKYPTKFTIPDDNRFPNIISAEVIGGRPLSESVPLAQNVKRRKLVPRKWIGMDEDPTEYWFHNQIHSFGNTNVFGGFHASAAPFATWLIDRLAYDGIDVRAVIANDLRDVVNKTNAYIIDLCCGVGMSTRALASAFPDAEFICGIDTSPEMISMARYITENIDLFNAIKGPTDRSEFAAGFMKVFAEIRNTASPSSLNIDYAIGNAERILSPEKKFDLVTIMYAFHEIPKSARYRILREARRLLAPGGTLAIVDINPTDYVPSASMLAGEPYVLEYKKNIERQIERFQGFHDLQSRDVVPGLLKIWTLKRNNEVAPKEVDKSVYLAAAME